jgi:hypothetical protein
LNTNTKRAFSALATAAVLTVTLFGIAGLTATKASAATCEWISAPTTGNVGDTLQFKVRITGAETSDLRSWSLSGPNWARTLDSATLLAPGFGGEPGYIESTASYTFNSAGSFRVTGPLSECGSITVTIAAVSTPTATPSATVGGGGTGGDGQSTAAPLLSEEGIVDIAAQAETATGMGSSRLLIVLAVIIIVILAIIATALLMRRRE